MTSTIKELYLQEMINEKKSSEFLREEEALRLMEQGIINSIKFTRIILISS